MRAYFTPDEAAEVLEVDGSTVRLWIRAGKLPAVRVGARYRIPAELVISAGAQTGQAVVEELAHERMAQAVELTAPGDIESAVNTRAIAVHGHGAVVARESPWQRT